MNVGDIIVYAIQDGSGNMLASVFKTGDSVVIKKYAGRESLEHYKCICS